MSLPHCSNHSANDKDCLLCDYNIINYLDLRNSHYNNITSIEWIMRNNIQGKIIMTIAEESNFGSQATFPLMKYGEEILLKHQGIVLDREEQYKYFFTDAFEKQYSHLINILGNFESTTTKYSIKLGNSDIPYYSVNDDLLSLIDAEKIIKNITKDKDRKLCDNLCNVLFPSLSLREENESLKKRVIQLECEPYRGPDFFEMLREEMNNGVIKN